MTSDKIRHKYSKAIKYIFSILLSVVFLYFAFQNVNVKDVFYHISQASVFWIFVFIVVNLSSHWVRALRWKVILRSVKPETSVKNLFGAIMVGYGVNCVVPRLGEVSRAVLVGKWEKLSRSSMLGAVIVERVIDIIFLAFAVIVSALLWSENLYDKFPWLKSSIYLSLILMGLMIVFFYLMIKFKERFYNVLINLIGKVSQKLAHKAGHIFDMLIEGFGSLKGRKNYFLTILLSVAIMALYALNSYVGFFTIGLQTLKPVNYEMGWIVMSISAIGVVIPTPGGTGSYHVLATSALVLLFGFGHDISLAYAVLTHGISYFLFIFSAVLVYLIIDKRHDNFFKVAENELDEI
ncbi:MAG: lysylphosphatidylglycerol synthase transmembrane domain-containing protein [Ignavibacteriaceae bacterium]